MTPTPSFAAAAGVDGSRKKQALSRLMARYGEARKLVSSEVCANLDWILGAKIHPDERPADLDHKMIPLLALWLQDLAVVVERGLSPGPPGEVDESASLAHPSRESVAASLREATDGFLVAFSPSA